MKAPDFDTTVAATSARLPNHPGAVDYFEREQQTFLDRYEDYIYLFAFFGGTIGSCFAWIGQRLARKRRERVDFVLDRLLDIMREVRAATSASGTRRHRRSRPTGWWPTWSATPASAASTRGRSAR
ncbi:hypothetical protein ACU4GR_32905 [Methylobacterium oryzae CBMB20]